MVFFVGVVLWKHILNRLNLGWLLNEQQIHVMLDFAFHDS